MARATQWRLGIREELWEKPESRGPPRGNSRLPKQKLKTNRDKAVERAAAEGSLSKAAKLLLQADMPRIDTPVTVIQQAMEALHPCEVVLHPPLVPVDDMADVCPDEVLCALKSFPMGTSAGPSGLRLCHILESLSGGDALQDRTY